MNRCLRLAVLLLVTTMPLAAQETPTQQTAETQERAGKMGIGISLNPTALLVFGEGSFLFAPIGFNNFLIPIRAGENFTWEPEFGVFRSSSSGGGTESQQTSLRLGIGALFNMRERGNLTPYVGPRFGIIRSSSKDKSSFASFSSHQTSWYLSGVLGAQYFFSRHFSLGGEIQLSRLSIGEEKTEPPSSAPDESQSVISTGGVMMLRWYF